MYASMAAPLTTQTVNVPAVTVCGCVPREYDRRRGRPCRKPGVCTWRASVRVCATGTPTCLVGAYSGMGPSHQESAFRQEGYSPVCVSRLSRARVCVHMIRCLKFCMYAGMLCSPLCGACRPRAHIRHLCVRVWSSVSLVLCARPSLPLQPHSHTLVLCSLCLQSVRRRSRAVLLKGLCSSGRWS